MADWNEINNGFSTRLEAQWTETAIAWDNVDYLPTTNTEFIRAVLLPARSDNIALGDKVINPGIYWIQIFTPINVGSGRAYELAAMLEPIFANVEFDGIVCYAADTQRVGDTGDGWYQLNFKANFWSAD